MLYFAQIIGKPGENRGRKAIGSKVYRYYDRQAAILMGPKI